MTGAREHPCDLCGGTDAVEVPHARLYTNDQPIHICRGCGFVHVKLRRSAEEIAASWSDDLYGDGYTARIPAVKARQVYVADFIDDRVGLKDKLVLDIGAGEGQFLQIARDDYGARLFGIEPSAAHCKNLKTAGFECFHGTIEDYVAAGESRRADVVTIMWTLENCQSCATMLRGAYDSLKDGGHLAIATGSRILVPFKKPLGDYLSTNPADTHSFRFSANTLRGLMANAGFATVHINRYLDTDYLCVIGQKQPAGTKIEWQGDDFVAVYDFFDRWHRESVHYR